MVSDLSIGAKPQVSRLRVTVKFAILGFLVAHVWEVLQMPFFAPGDLSPYERTLRCTVASIGDGMVMAAGAWLTATFGKSASWPYGPSRAGHFIYFGFGVVVAVIVELVATNLPVSSIFSWRYSTSMPMLPVIDLAIIPLLMWVMVPAVTLLLVKFMQK